MDDPRGSITPNVRHYDDKARLPGAPAGRSADGPLPWRSSALLLTIDYGPLANFHITFITDSAKHYHKECTELYYILEGIGTLELNDVVTVEPCTLIS